MSINLTQILQQVLNAIISILPLAIQLMVLALVLRLVFSAFKPVKAREAVKKEEKTGGS